MFTGLRIYILEKLSFYSTPRFFGKSDVPVNPKFSPDDHDDGSNLPAKDLLNIWDLIYPVFQHVQKDSNCVV